MCRYILIYRSAFCAISKSALLATLLCMPCLAIATELEAPKASDIRMVIDISGSMKKNDPKNLRQPALDMLVKLMPKGSKAGIWSFGQQVNMLVPHQKVDSAWGKKASASASKIRSIAQFTNIGEALEKAAYDYQSQNSDYQKHVILLTDGMVDIDRNANANVKERQRILNSILPRYKKAGFTLHTIALSDNADKTLLNKLALMTDGKAAIANNADELMNAFLQVFDQAVPAEEVPFDGDSFVVDSSIEEFTALIFRKPNGKDTHIIAPDGQQYDKAVKDTYINWHHTNKYDLITIKQPVEGEWKVSADLEPQSRITVVSDLSLVVQSMPTNIALNEVISTSLALREENKTVTRVEFLGLLDIDMAVSSTNGKQWSERLSKDLVPEDGLYPATLNQFDTEGQYTISFTVDGKSFNRQFNHQVSVRQPFLMDVKQQQQNSGLSEFVITVVSQSQNIDIPSVAVIADLQKPSGRSQILPFSQTPEGDWSLTVSPEKTGDYLLGINVKGNNLQSQAFEIDLKTLRLSQTEGGKIEEVNEPEPEAAPEPIAEESAQPDEPLPEPEPAEEDKLMQIILYSIIGVVNLLIIVIAYILYRKLFKKKSAEESEDTSDSSEAEEDGFTEPPMDEMAIDDLDELEEESEAEEDAAPKEEPVENTQESDNESEAKSELAAEPEAELEEETPTEPETEAADPESDNSEADADESGDNIDLDDDEDDVPDFSLDDFSPESVEDEDLGDDVDEENKD